MRGRQRLELLIGNHGRINLGATRSFRLGGMTVARQKRRTEGAHIAGDVGANGVDLSELFEGTQYRIVQEGSALHDNFASDFLGVADFDDLEQCVLNNGQGQTGGDVANRGAFLLRLLNAGVHEDRAATAQIDWVICLDGGLGELRNL